MDILGISLIYLGDIFGDIFSIIGGYLGDILGRSRGYLWDIMEISGAHLGDIWGVSEGCCISSAIHTHGLSAEGAKTDVNQKELLDHSPCNSSISSFGSLCSLCSNISI